MFQIYFQDGYFFTLLNDLSVILDEQGEANSKLLKDFLYFLSRVKSPQGGIFGFELFMETRKQSF